MGEMEASENVLSVCENYCANYESLIQFSESIIIYLLGQHFISKLKYSALDYHML